MESGAIMASWQSLVYCEFKFVESKSLQLTKQVFTTVEYSGNVSIYPNYAIPRIIYGIK